MYGSEPGSTPQQHRGRREAADDTEQVPSGGPDTEQLPDGTAGAPCSWGGARRRGRSAAPPWGHATQRGPPAHSAAPDPTAPTVPASPWPATATSPLRPPPPAPLPPALCQSRSPEAFAQHLSLRYPRTDLIDVTPIIQVSPNAELMHLCVQTS